MPSESTSGAAFSANRTSGIAGIGTRHAHSMSLASSFTSRNLSANAAAWSPFTNAGNSSFSSNQATVQNGVSFDSIHKDNNAPGIGRGAPASGTSSPNPFGPNATLGSDLLPPSSHSHSPGHGLARRSPLSTIAQVADADELEEEDVGHEMMRVHAPQGRVPLSVSKVQRGGEAQPDFARGFGLDIAEESEVEDEGESIAQSYTRDGESASIAESDVDGGWVDTQRRPAYNVSESEDGDEDKENNSFSFSTEKETNIGLGHNRHESRLSAALSMRSFTGLVEDGLNSLHARNSSHNSHHSQHIHSQSYSHAEKESGLGLSLGNGHSHHNSLGVGNVLGVTPKSVLENKENIAEGLSPNVERELEEWTASEIEDDEQVSVPCNSLVLREASLATGCDYRLISVVFYGAPPLLFCLLFGPGSEGQSGWIRKACQPRVPNFMNVFLHSSFVPGSASPLY